MKKWFLPLLLLPVAAHGTDALPEDTVIHIETPRTVTVLETDSSVSVAIRGSRDNAGYRFDYRKDFGRGDGVVTRQHSAALDFSFPFPFQKSERKKAGQQKRGSFCTMGGVGFGFVTALGTPAGMSVDMGSSYEIFADIISFGRYLPRRTSISLGLGIDWRNYRLTGHTRFVKADGNVVLSPYPDGADVDFSRVKVFSLTFPLRFQHELGRHVSYSLAAILNLNTYASVKTRYSLDGRDYRDLQKNIHQVRTSVDFMGQVQYRSVGAYVKYSPCHVLKSDFGPTFTPLSVGLTLFY